MTKKPENLESEIPDSIALFEKLDSEYADLEKIILNFPSSGNIISFLLFLQKVKKSQLRDSTREVTKNLYKNLFSRMRTGQEALRGQYGKEVFERARGRVKNILSLDLKDEEVGVSLKAIEPKKVKSIKKAETKNKSELGGSPQGKKLKTKKTPKPSQAKPGKVFEHKKLENKKRIAEHVEKKKEQKKPKKISRKTK